MNKQKTESIWDKTNSTYMRIIYLKNGYTLTGYSKKYLQNERIDKIDLLTNWILRDFKNGYLDKKTANTKITELDRIEYFIKQNGTYSPVINLYYDFPEWVNLKWAEQRKFAAFINKLYNMIRRNTGVSEIVNALEIRTRSSARDPLDISTARFMGLPDLNAYVHKLISEGNLEGEAIENFYRKYKEKFLSNLNAKQ